MTWNGHKIPTFITAAVAVAGAAGGLIWWTAHQEGRIAANELAVTKIEQSQNEARATLAQVSILSERVNLLNGQLASNKELADKIAKQQETMTRMLDDIKASVNKP